MRVSESGGAGTSPLLLGRRSGGREGRVTPLNRVTPRHAQEPQKKRRVTPPRSFFKNYVNPSIPKDKVVWMMNLKNITL